MKSLFRASILGLGHTEVISLRQHITTILAGVDIDWVGANHEKLDFLIVNSNFINASSVQNLLRSNKMPVLLATHASDEVVEGKDTIRLPLLECSKLKLWIQEFVLSDQSISQPIIKSQEYVITQVLLDNNKIFEYLRTANDGLFYLSDRCGAVGYVDTNRQLMYLLPERRNSLDMQGSLTYERILQLPKAYQSVDLLQWFWHVAWSTSSCSLFVQPNQIVKLKFWPQPTQRSDRRDLLLMSAKLTQGAINAEILAKALNIPVARAQQFMSALVMSGFGELLNESVAITPPATPSKIVNTEEATGLRRLLMGVRRRFGL